MKRIRLSILGAAAISAGAFLAFASAAGPNLVANGAFPANVAGWDSFGGNPQWEAGTMKVTNNYLGTGNSYYSGWYCVGGIQPGVQYTTSGQVFIPPAAVDNTGASLGTHFYASNDCSGGNLLTGGGLQYGWTKASWITLSFNEVAPAGAHSVRVRATSVKHPNPSSSAIPGTHVTFWDNIYYGETASEPTPTNTPKPTSTPTVVPTSTPKPSVTPPPGQPGGPGQPEVPTPIGWDGPIDWPTPQPSATATPGNSVTPPATPPTVVKPADPQPQVNEPGDDQPSVPGEPAQDTPLPPATGNGHPASGGNGLALLFAAIGAMLLGFGGAGVATIKRK